MGGVMPRRFLGVFLAALTLISPAVARDLVTSDGRPVRKIAVVSQLGDGFHLMQETGKFFSTSTEDAYIPVPNWKIDERIELRIVEALAARFTVAPMTEDELEGRSPVDADAVVWVAAAGDTDNFYVGDPHSAFLQGLGLYRSTGTLAEVTGLFAVYDIAIFDAKTKREIVRHRAKVGGLSSHAAEFVDQRFWPGNDRPPRAEKIPPIRDAITALVDKSLDWTLKKLD